MRRLWVLAALLCGCTGRHAPAPLPDRTTPAPKAPRAAALPAARPQLDGHDFPDKVLALTWDDGPDVHTLDLARYLHAAGVSGTFFVVRAWIDGVSADPGVGERIFATGYAALPVLGELVRLGQRLGNHTAAHVLLDRVAPAEVVRQLRDNQAAITPFLGAGPRLFRAPGGAWTAAASTAVDGDAGLARLVGPIRWDIDAKDWEGSRWCDSQSPATECEPDAPGGERRVKPAVIAHRYLAQIDAAKHGIVLLHDRVGDVGSRYALDVARALVPALRAAGYVFAAPRLRFSAPGPAPGSLAVATSGPAGAVLGDVNGDGRVDRCGRVARGVACALATPAGFTSESLWLDRGDPGAATLVDAATLALQDVDHDGRADLCAATAAGLLCARAP